jgi:hypothetical protein
MEHLSSAIEQQIEWRRDKIQELCSKGYSQREMSQVLQVGLATVGLVTCKGVLLNEGGFTYKCYRSR